ncbi:uncharacterized protein MYCFIDRAFT_175199 [Pseudocercospora fijiensis CIRAD86]|uniref:Uncharacterized protein n=1 Tax=Pseudocercospora fijiensis (strain CIRAD86) TaxID=383855 RepID=M3AVV8_PSEFD|nr:uncharacterized protein MYCFIDRAFT_175199 [Pseudocercospora fijiensis CIRAD86]EME81607.1 hypothetical protein MYCFIDRAFT_175199 [Pseudocercospora fijiensis CIRAD86]
MHASSTCEVGNRRKASKAIDQDLALFYDLRRTNGIPGSIDGWRSCSSRNPPLVAYMHGNPPAASTGALTNEVAQSGELR